MFWSNAWIYVLVVPVWSFILDFSGLYRQFIGLSPGGVLATFSCSGLVSMEHFKRMIGWSSVDAGRTVRIVEQLGQPPDHPVLSTFPESEYLKGLICVVA